jgi:hypothetical protein
MTRAAGAKGGYSADHCYPSCDDLSVHGPGLSKSVDHDNCGIQMQRSLPPSTRLRTGVRCTIGLTGTAQRDEGDYPEQIG